MRTIDRKLLRDMGHLRAQIAAIVLLVAVGIATVVTTRSTFRSLSVTLEAYYADYRFADVFVHLKRAPLSVADRIAALPGVRTVAPRIVAEVVLDVPGLAEPAAGRLVSIPDQGEAPLNLLYLREGRFPEPARAAEVVVSEAFAVANRLHAGDSLGAVLNGRWQRLRIVGVGLSPEFVYEIRATDIFPDSRRFGVIWMGHRAVAAAFDFGGSFNDVSLALNPGAVPADVVAGVDRLLERYGGIGAVVRADQVSHRFVSDELKQNQRSGTFVPAIFLGIAAFLLNIVLSRLVSTQRDQIAVLKAFGYSNRTIATHFLKLAGAMLVMGTVCGIALGTYLAGWQVRMYARYYRFPTFRHEFDAGAIAAAFAITAVAAVLGALGAVRSAASLAPAQAMRPDQPARFRPGLLERSGLAAALSVPNRMIARNLTRRPVKALLSVIGIAWSVAILIVGRQLLDSIAYIADFQFGVVQRETLTLAFSGPRPARARQELARLPGARIAEPFRVVPARLRSGHHMRLVPLTGLDRGGELRRLVDRDGTVFPIPADGLVLTTKLADVLGVRPGDSIQAEILEGARPTRTLAVAATVDELIGLSAYIDREALNRVLHEGGTVSGALIKVDADRTDELYRLLKRTPGGSGVTNRDAAWRSFETTLQASMGIFTTVLTVLACLVAFSLVYNVARIALSERGRELASLRVLGFTRGEIGVMLLGEQALLTGAAVPLGMLLGYGTSALLSRAYQWELYRLPLVITPTTYLFAAGTVLIAAAASALLVRRRLNRLDLIAVLKTRE